MLLQQQGTKGSLKNRIYYHYSEGIKKNNAGKGDRNGKATANEINMCQV